MGMYTGLRFKGVVKKEFREKLKDIALNGEWETSEDEILSKFAEIERAGFIPCGALTYMPGNWQKGPYDEYGDGAATEGFERSYDKETGIWTFQCSLKNYEGTIQEFFNIVPYFIESVEHAEVYYEESAYSTKYELKDGVMVDTDNKFIQYGYVD